MTACAAALPLAAGGAVGSAVAASAPAPRADAAPDQAIAVRVPAALREPIWAGSGHALVALDDRHRVVKVVPGGAPRATPVQSRVSAGMPAIGRNVVVSPVDENVLYVPEPGQDDVAVLSLADLHRIGSLEAGPSPAYLTTNKGFGMLLALSRDGTRVTPVEVGFRDTVDAPQRFSSPVTEIDGAVRGSYVDYSALTGSEMIHEKGDPSHVGVNGRIPVVAETAAGDKWKTSRVYAAVKGTDELLAIDTTHELNGLEVVGRAHAGSPIDYLGADKTRVYAATESVLVVLAANTFEGYDHGKMTIMRRIHFRDALPASVRNAPLSGLAVGPNRVYLTLQGVPYVLSVAKPSV